MFRRLTSLLALALSGACGGPPTGDSGPEPVAEGPAAVARQLAADHTGLSPAEIIVVEIEATDFPSPALGCPQPDTGYPAVITPGHRVRVRAGDQLLDVRVAGKTGLVCTEPRQLPTG